jgi:hypothetical protein
VAPAFSLLGGGEEGAGTTGATGDRSHRVGQFENAVTTGGFLSAASDRHGFRK